MSLSLEPAFEIDLTLVSPVANVNTTNGETLYVTIGSGSIKSTGSKPLDINVTHGHDTLFVSATKKYANLDCHVYGQTADKKHNVKVYYSGVARPTQGKLFKVMGGELDTMSFDEGYLSNLIHITLDHEGDSSDISWLTSSAFVGRGRFTHDKDGELHVQYKCFALE